jgi:hypothetical protein
MEPSATPSPSKRVRFEHNNANLNSTAGTPATKAKLLIRQGLESLDNTVVPYFLRFPTKLFTNSLRIALKRKAISKLDTTHIPSSLRLKLSLDGSSTAKKTREFQDLSTKFDATLLTFQDTIKTIFKDVLYLDISIISEDSINNFISFGDSLIDYFALVEKHLNPVPPSKKHAILTHLIHSGVTAPLNIGNEMFLLSVDEKYNIFTNHPPESPSTSDSASIDSNDISIDSNEFTSSHQTPTDPLAGFEPLFQLLQHTMLKCIRDPMAAYEDHLNQATFKRTLAKFVETEIDKNKATNTASFIDDLNNSTNNATLQQVIDMELKKQKSALLRKHAHLETQVKALSKKLAATTLPAKNVQREGSVRPSRSPSRRTTSPDTRHNQPRNAPHKTANNSRTVTPSPQPPTSANPKSKNQNRQRQTRSRSPATRTSETQQSAQQSKEKRGKAEGLSSGERKKR